MSVSMSGCCILNVCTAETDTDILIDDNLNKIHEHGPPATKTFSDGRLAIKTELPVARRKRERERLEHGQNCRRGNEKKCRTA